MTGARLFVILAACLAGATARSEAPRPGDTWTYRLTEQRRAGTVERRYVVTAEAASSAAVRERVAIDGGAPVASSHGRGMQLFASASGVFSPYLHVFQRLAGPLELGAIRIADPACGGTYACEARGYVVGAERVTVPAGTFDATKVVIEQSWHAATGGNRALSGSRVLTVWYSEEARRAVKYSSRLAYGDAPPMEANFDLELASVRFAGEDRPLAAPKLPQAGDNWTYRVTELKKGGLQRTVFVQVSSASPSLVVEQVSIQGGFTMPWRHTRGGYLIPQGVSVLSPYLPQFAQPVPGTELGYIESADPGCRRLFVCQASGTWVGEETVQVAAGSFRAIKAEVKQTWRPAAGASSDKTELARMNGARTVTVWYSPDLRRTVKIQSRLTAGERVPLETDYDLEVLSYEVKSFPISPAPSR